MNRSFLLLHLLVTLWLVTSPLHAQTDLKVQVRATLPSGIVHLLQSMSGEMGYLPDAWRKLTESRDYKAEEKRILAGVRDLLLRQSGERGLSLPRTLREEAYSHETVAGFLSALKMKISAREYETVEDAVLLVADDYQRLVWDPARERLAEEKALIEGQFSSPVGLQLFEQALAFYPGEQERLYQVSLVPLPPNPSPSSAALALPEGVMLQVPARSLEGAGGGIVFHEIVHLLQERSALADEIRAMFSKRGSTQAGIELNEAVATVLGNYLFQLRVTGKVPQGTLYSDPYVEGYARSMIPILEEALAEARPFDERFADRAVTAYQNAYPRRLGDPSYVFRHIVFAGVDETLLPTAIEALVQPSPLRSAFRMFPLTRAAIVELDASTLTRVFVLTPDQLLSVSELLSAEGLAALSSAPGGVWSQRDEVRWSFFVVDPSHDSAAWTASLRALFQRRTLVEGLFPSTP